ncbi:MAG: hypothetical protein LRY51_15740 [Geovibrio sp.]|nr:hypothetical protein [Geovibrio sp.]
MREDFRFHGAEAEGANLDIIIPEKHRKRHWDGFYKVLETGRTAYSGKMLKVPAIRKDGEKLIIEFSMQIIEQEEKRGSRLCQGCCTEIKKSGWNSPPAF